MRKNDQLIKMYKSSLNKNWQIPIEYLTNDNIILLIKYLLERVNNCRTKQDIIKIYSKNLLIDNGLKYLFDIYDNTYDIIQIVYPNKFKQWEIKDSINNQEKYWTEDKLIECVKWIIEDELKYTVEEINKYNAYRIKIDLKLHEYIISKYTPSISYILELAYPGKFNIWEFDKRIPKNYWKNKNNIIRAMKWLMEEKYNIFIDSSRRLTTDIFRKYGLDKLLKIYSIYELVELAYPGEFKPWEICKAPKGYWTRETAIEAFRWLIEDILKYQPNEIKKKLKLDSIINYGLLTPFINIFNRSKSQIIEALYPNTINKERE